MNTKRLRILGKATRKAAMLAQDPVDVNVRARFEAWIKAPPFERRCIRWPDDTPDTAWPGTYRSYDVELAWQAWKTATENRAVDCGKCRNKGQVDGLSQESYCEHCKWHEQWRTDHYVP